MQFPKSDFDNQYNIAINWLQLSEQAQEQGRLMDASNYLNNASHAVAQLSAKLECFLEVRQRSILSAGKYASSGANLFRATH